MKNILNFIFSKKDEGIYRTYRIFGIKIITKPIRLKLDMIENLIFTKMQEIETKLNNDEIFSDMILYKDKEKIFYLKSVDYENTGDNAIVYANIQLLKDIFPNKIILEYTLNDIARANNFIKKMITEEDIIFMPGGGNLGNLYLIEEIARRQIIKCYNKNQIIIFPQTIYWTEDEEGKKELEITKNIYNSHKNLTIMTRDEKSYKFAKEHFNSNIILCPDSAFYLYNKININEKNRNGVIFILRDDKEKILDGNLINNVQVYLNSINKNYFFYDEYMEKYKIINKSEREDYIFERLNKISEYELCITDRLHGLIFSYITNTPCIAFNNIDNKVEGTAKWLENVEWIYMAKEKDDINSIKLIIDKYLSKNFNKNEIIFDNKMKEIIKNSIKL